MRRTLVSLGLLLSSAIGWSAPAHASCEPILTAYFDQDPEAAMRAGRDRAVPEHILALKNGSSRVGWVYEARDLVAPADPLVHREQVTGLRRGDVVNTADGPLELGRFRGWGGTTHLFEIANRPGWLLRIPRAVRILYTNPGFATREQKTRYFYEAFRGAVRPAIERGLPLLPMRILDGLILVQDVQPFETAAHLARDPAAPEFAERRRAFVAFLRGLAGRPGLTDLHLDAVVWLPGERAFRIADFERLTPEPTDDARLSAAYAPLLAEARDAGLITAQDELPTAEKELRVKTRFHSTKAIRPPLDGLIVPLVTPLDPRGEMATKDFARLIDHVVENGADAVLVLGSNGEGPSLPPAQQRRVIRAATRYVGRRAHVLVNVSANARAETVALARVARAAGAGAVALTPPGYFRATDDELVAYVRGLADELELPIFLYNIPQLTKTAYSPAVVARLARHHQVVGLKDSSGDVENFRATRDALNGRADFALLIGSESILAECLHEGAAGGVCGSANLRPQLIAALVRAEKARDFAAGQAAQEELVRWKNVLATVGGRDPNGALKCFKSGLVAMGVCASDRTAPPLAPLDAAAASALRDHLRDLGWLP